jgi:outer membrane protein OmpA-like peptidoglycan-associated protein
MKLSVRRGDVAVNYLKSKGVEKKRIEATGYGLSRIVNKCVKGVSCTDAEEQLNRRVEFHFEEEVVTAVK